MTEFKEGDRVKVEFEGTLHERHYDGTWYVAGDGYDDEEVVYLFEEHMTKIEPALPTKVGSVIESHGYRFMLTAFGWHAAVDKFPYAADAFENPMYAEDFTVVLEGK